MKSTDLESLKNNLLTDIDQATKSNIEDIYKALITSLNKYDKDGLLKNVKDHVILFFTPDKRAKCKYIITDIIDSKESLSTDEKESLRKNFLDISNIHRTLLENIQALLDAL